MPYQEIEAMARLLAGLLFDARTGGLMLLLFLAAICDYRTRRIPNRLVFFGAAFGVIYTTMVPPVIHGTVLFPLSGLLVGFLVFLPLYLVRAMGAGDVKLLAMVGAFLGPVETIWVALASMIVGGVVSIVWVLAHGRMFRMLENLVSFFQYGMLGAIAGTTSGMRITQEASAGILPYGVVIATGTMGYLSLHVLGFV